MDRWEGKVAVVTGASAGIGATIAEVLVQKGLRVVGLARRNEKLEALSGKLAGAKGKLYARQCDVTKEEDILNAFAWTKKELGGVDVLVNNAGVIQFETIIGGSTKGYQNILDVNVLGPAICVREAFRSMQERGVNGHIFNINSIAGHEIVPMPLSLYCPSKFAITALTDAVRKELVNANTKIKVTSISPGAVETEIAAAAGMPNSDEFFQEHPSLRPQDIADALLFALGSPPHVQVTELTIRPVGEV